MSWHFFGTDIYCTLTVRVKSAELCSWQRENQFLFQVVIKMTTSVGKKCVCEILVQIYSICTTRQLSSSYECIFYVRKKMDYIDTNYVCFMILLHRIKGVLMGVFAPSVESVCINWPEPISMTALNYDCSSVIFVSSIK